MSVISIVRSNYYKSIAYLLESTSNTNMVGGC